MAPRHIYVGWAAQTMTERNIVDRIAEAIWAMPSDLEIEITADGKVGALYYESSRHEQ
jgi:hypothetical protein